MNRPSEDRALEAALARWAIEPAGDPAAVARIIRHGDALVQPAPRRRWWLAAAGMAAAASLAAVMLVPGQPRQVTPEGASNGEASFLLLHSPAPYEETLL